MDFINPLLGGKKTDPERGEDRAAGKRWI